jgi:large subunit ribosomal protein L10
MSRLMKNYIVEEIAGKLDGLDGVIIVGFEGLTVEHAEVLRGMLSEQELGMTVVKNALAARALEKVGMGPVSEYLEGQSAFLYGRNDGTITVTRLLGDFTKKTKSKAVQIRGGFLDGRVLDAEAASALAKLPTRLEMIGKVVTQAKSPGAMLAGAIRGPGGTIAACIESLVKKLEGEQGGGEEG